MTTLESKFKYLDEQLQQVNQMLDTEWEQHLNKSKAKVITTSIAQGAFESRSDEWRRLYILHWELFNESLHVWGP